jgi:glycosyltransferase involved in cell wall biosynthesis
MTQPDIAVLVSTFERPQHLRRVLASIAAQQGVTGKFEVVVTDDGSRDQTPRFVQQFAATVDFPVRFTTHRHDGFQLARCRNEGVAASTAPYLLFLDGDCIIPPNHLQIHLARRRPQHAMAGYYLRLNRADTERLTEDDVRAGRYRNVIRWRQHWRMAWRHVQAEFYSLIRDPQRPKLFGGNIGIARTDYERVNGYDENFQGWGCEDDDLRLRLRTAGVRVASIAWWTQTYHQWHPKTPTAPNKWREGLNVEYLHRPVRLIRCLAGLKKRRLQDLVVRIVGRRPPSEVLDRVLPLWCRVAVAASKGTDEPAEVEIAFAPAADCFSPSCECRVLLVPQGATATRTVVNEANLIFSDQQIGRMASGRCFALQSFDGVLSRQLGAPRTSIRESQRQYQAA